MATWQERLEQLEQALQRAAGLRHLETAAGAPAPPVTTTSSASMVDMRVLGKPSNFAGDEASWKSWCFVMLPFSAAVSPELRTLMEKARTTAEDMKNVNLTPSEQVWSRQLYHMLSLITSGEAQRRLQNVPEVYLYEPNTATRYVGMLRQIILCDFGRPTQLIGRNEQFRHLVSQYEEQSGESVTDNVR